MIEGNGRGRPGSTGSVLLIVWFALLVGGGRAEAQASPANNPAGRPSDSERAPDVERPPPLAGAARKGQHTGIFTRATFGVGFASVVTKAPPSEQAFDKIVFDGFCWHMSADFGASIVPNLLLHIRGAAYALFQPNASADGGGKMDTRDFSVLMGAAGPAITYYLMPANVYVTAGIGIAALRLSSGKNDILLVANSDIGLWLTVDVGWEGWVDDAWSVGVAGRAMYATMGGGDGSDVSTTAFGLVLSVTNTSGS